MERTKILIAETERAKRVKEFFALSTFVEKFCDYKLELMAKAGYDFKPGSDVTKTSENLAKISREISLAFKLSLLPDGSGQRMLTMYDSDALTADMLNDIIDQLEGETDRGCTYICEMVMAFPNWAIMKRDMPKSVHVRQSMHGEFSKEKVDGDLIETMNGDIVETKPFNSYVIFDHIFIPDKNNPERKTITQFSLGKRYSDGLLGTTLNKLMESLNYYGFQYFTR